MNGIGGYVTTPAAYGGYAATPGNEAFLMAQRNNPFRYLMTGTGHDEPQEYASGGVAQSGVAKAGQAASLLDLLMNIGGQGDQQRSAELHSIDGSAGPSQGGQNSGNTPASASGANYGPTSQGMDGLSPGRGAIGSALGLGGFGSAALGMAMGQAIPGSGLISKIGDAFNGGARSSQLSDMVGQLSGALPGQQGIGSFLGGALGFGMGTKDTAFGQAAMGHNLNPDQADTALSNYAATGDINMSAAQAAAIAANTPGMGIAGLGGAASSGQSATGLNMGPSAAAFGQGFAGNVTGAVGNDGVASMSGTPGAGFGAQTGSGDTSGQGGSGANGAGGASGGGSGGGGGANGGGGDNGGGYAGGGLIRSTGGEFFTKKLAKGSGLVTGISQGRADKVGIHVPHGAYVMPADVVSGMGQGNTTAGARALKGMMPSDGRLHFASGGIAGEAPAVPIQVSAGEFVVHPAHVAALGGGDPQAGAAALDGLVARVRQANAQVAQGMPAPK